MYNLRTRLRMDASTVGGRNGIESLQVLARVLQGENIDVTEEGAIHAAANDLENPAQALRNGHQRLQRLLAGRDDVSLPENWKPDAAELTELVDVRNLLEQYQAEIGRPAQPTPTVERPRPEPRGKIVDHIDPDELAKRVQRGNEIKAAQREHWRAHHTRHDDPQRGHSGGRS